MKLEKAMKIAYKEIARAENSKRKMSPEAEKNWEERLRSQAELIMKDSTQRTPKRTKKPRRKSK